MLEISVCVGSACHLRGASNVVQVFQQMLEENQLHGEIALKGMSCIRECQKTGVKVTFKNQVHYIRPENAREFFKSTVMPMLVKDKMDACTNALPVPPCVQK